MKNRTLNHPARKYSIGLPRALLYFRYGILWDSFLTSLGEKVIVSVPTNKEILQLGSEAAIDESCLSLKIYLGHVRSLIGKCDYILVPRISNFGRQRNMCTRFEALYDLVCNTFRETGQKFIGYNIAVSKKMTEEDAFMELGQELGSSYKEVKKAYHTAQEKSSISCLKGQTLIQNKPSVSEGYFSASLEKALFFFGFLGFYLFQCLVLDFPISIE